MLLFKTTLCAVYFLSVILVTRSAVFIEVQKLKSGDSPWCIDNDAKDNSQDSVFNIGEVWYPHGLCLRKQCGFYDELEGKVQITTHTCGMVDAPEHCLVSDLSKPYPECCPQIIKCCL